LNIRKKIRLSWQRKLVENKPIGLSIVSADFQMSFKRQIIEHYPNRTKHKLIARINSKACAQASHETNLNF
ncbi:hypothetical protein BpHYR1_005239, partial [Brachionus plicatilis]